MYNVRRDYSIPKMNQYNFISPYVIDTNEQITIPNYYFQGNFSSCPLSSKSSSFSFVTTAVSYAINLNYGYFNYYTQGINEYVILEATDNNSTNYGAYYFQFGGESPQSPSPAPGHSPIPLIDPCFTLICSGGTNVPPAASIVSLYNTPLVVDTSDSNQVGVTGILIVDGTTISASCVANIYGALIPYFSVSKSVQPSGVYECTIDNSVVSSLSTSLSFCLSAYTGFIQIAAAFVILLHLGPDIIIYLLDGGRLTMESIIGRFEE
jgi:hypothetical protein